MGIKIGLILLNTYVKKYEESLCLSCLPYRSHSWLLQPVLTPPVLISR